MGSRVYILLDTLVHKKGLKALSNFHENNSVTSFTRAALKTYLTYYLLYIS